MHRSREIEKREKTQKEGKNTDKLPVLLGRHDLNEKSKPSEKAKAGYEKANLSHRRDDYRKIDFSDSKEAKAEEMAKRYPNQVERELICSFAGQWVLRKPTETPGLKLRDAPRNHQQVPADMFEITDSGALFDISLSQYILSDYDKGWHLGDLKVKQYLSDVTGKHLTLSQTDKEGTEHTASVSHFLQDDDGNTFPQTLQWNNGEVWTRKRPELKNLNGHWHKFLPNGKCVPMSIPRWAPTNHGPNGELEVWISLDSENIEKLWVFMEQDPEHPGSQRLRWSNGQLWYPGQGSIAKRCSFSRTAPHLEKFSSKELQSRECSPVLASPSDSSISQDTGSTHKTSPMEESLYVQSAEFLLAHIQDRDREIQESLSSVEDVCKELQSRECSPVIASPSDSSISQDTHKISPMEESLYVQSAEFYTSLLEELLAHTQSRNREIQESLSSVEDVYKEQLESRTKQVWLEEQNRLQQDNEILRQRLEAAQRRLSEISFNSEQKSHLFSDSNSEKEKLMQANLVFHDQLTLMRQTVEAERNQRVAKTEEVRLLNVRLEAAHAELQAKFEGLLLGDDFKDLKLRLKLGQQTEDVKLVCPECLDSDECPILPSVEEMEEVDFEDSFCGSDGEVPIIPSSSCSAMFLSDQKYDTICDYSNQKIPNGTHKCVSTIPTLWPISAAIVEDEFDEDPDFEDSFCGSDGEVPIIPSSSCSAMFLSDQKYDTICDYSNQKIPNGTHKCVSTIPTLWPISAAIVEDEFDEDGNGDRKIQDCSLVSAAIMEDVLSFVDEVDCDLLSAAIMEDELDEHGKITSL